jgi:hypothetical protein
LAAAAADGNAAANKEIDEITFEYTILHANVEPH